MLFPLRIDLFLREIALFYTNFHYNSLICEAKLRVIRVMFGGLRKISSSAVLMVKLHVFALVYSTLNQALDSN